jgi:predicted nucleotidyltransferase
VKRERAVMLVEHVLRELDKAQTEWPLSLVTEVNVFGSFARGALEPHDVDIDVEHGSDRRWAEHFATCVAYDRDPNSVLKRLLTVGRRGCEFQFNLRGRAKFEMTPLWRRGDTLQDALGRLAAIRPDPEARRAPREAMLPQFEGLDRWIPLPLRQALMRAVADEAIAIERIVLPDSAAPHPSPWVREWGSLYPDWPPDHVYLDLRWPPTSPLYRAGSAVAADWDRRGIGLEQAQLHKGWLPTRGPDVAYFAGFSWRYYRCIPELLSKPASREWLEVVHPTLTRPLDTLCIRPRYRAKLKRSHWE